MLADPLPIVTRAPVIPVLTIAHVADAAPLARALVAGGLPVLEVTLRTEVALDAIAAIAREVPEAIVGVGTVTEPADVMRAVDAGAKYLVTPGTPPVLAEALARASIPAIPGCATVSEAMALAEHGFRVLKFFPAEACGGVKWLQAVAAPLPEARFCPTGGIDMKNAGAYLAQSNVVAVGGSWVAPQGALASGDFDRVTALAQDAAALGSHQP
jgi:2-dehydro-3-deoxyphosphogluconate aldolase / (4S)-4-hydroxy-2-oxoglutarate aldolase